MPEVVVAEDAAVTVIFRIHGSSAELAGRCLDAPLEDDAACVVLEARSGPCECDAGAGRSPLAGSIGRRAIDALEYEPESADWACFCEIERLGGAARKRCLTQLDSASVESGWCYVDAAASPPIGEPELTSACPEGEKRLVRFVGEASPAPGPAHSWSARLSSGAEFADSPIRSARSATISAGASRR